MELFGKKFFEPEEAAPLPEGCNFTIETIRNDEDPPEFKRTYKSKLDNRAVISITCRTRMFGDRSCDGTLTQPDGRYVYFDPKKVADKIIDPLLVPLVESACTTILTADKQFIDSKPPFFVDRKGQKWCRCEDAK